ncbi:MAG: hypothetical protein ACOVOD_01105 [Rhodoferax sp.]
MAPLCVVRETSVCSGSNILRWVKLSGEFGTSTPLWRCVRGGRRVTDRIAQSRGLSMNKRVEKLSAHALSAWDTKNHFSAMAATGDVKKALSDADLQNALEGQQ